jgi:hypothetical protein
MSPMLFDNTHYQSDEFKSSRETGLPIRERG